MATQFDRTLYRGDSLFFLDAVFQDLNTQQLLSIPVTTPTTFPPPGAIPFDIIGCKLTFTVKNTYVDADQNAVIQVSTIFPNPPGITILNPTSGTFSVTAPPILTIGAPDTPSDLVFDIQLIDASNRVSTIEVGKFTILPDVTRAIT